MQRKRETLLKNSFNSQPHTRLTELVVAIMFRALPFNSQPHTRLTNHPFNGTLQFRAFNSQPHTRLTQANADAIVTLDAFQFTASYEADLSTA